MAVNIETGKPNFGVLVRTRTPYILLDKLADAAHKIRVKVLSAYTALNAAGTTEQATITASEQQPNLLYEHHDIFVTLTIARIAEELSSLANKDGSPKFPGIEKAASFFRAKYEQIELPKHRERARARHVDLSQRAFELSGAELYTWYY